MQRFASFFDDDKDQSPHFWDKTSHLPFSKDWTPTNGDLFFQESKKRKGEMKHVYICLFKHYLVISKVKEWYKKYKSLDFSKHFVQFKILGSVPDPFIRGFSLTYNSKQIEIFSKNFNDVAHITNQLKKYVIQTNFNEAYTLHEKLGAGSYADIKVFKVEEKLTQVKYAAKIFKSPTKSPQVSKAIIMNEIIVQRHLDHPNTVRLHEIYENENKVVLILELVEGRRLLDYVMQHSPLPEKTCIILIKQLLEAIIYVHSLGIIHRDIKLENIMIMGEESANNDFHIKLLDFGLAVHTENIKFLKKSGTPGYIAPEIFFGDNYSPKVDIFSVGVVLYTMLSGRSPFMGPDRKTVLGYNKRCEYSLKGKYWAKQSANAKDLVRKMMEGDPAKRIDATRALDHPWFTLVYLNGVQPIVNLPKVMKVSNKHIFGSRPASPSGLNSSINQTSKPMDKADSEREFFEIRSRTMDRRKSTLDTNRSNGKLGLYLNHNFLQIPNHVWNPPPQTSNPLLTSVGFDEEKMDLSSYDDAINRVSSIRTFQKASSGANSPSSGGLERTPPKRQKMSAGSSILDIEVAKENPAITDKINTYVRLESHLKMSSNVDQRTPGAISLEGIPEAREDKQSCEVTITCEDSNGLQKVVAQLPKVEMVFLALSPHLKSPVALRKRLLNEK